MEYSDFKSIIFKLDPEDAHHYIDLISRYIISKSTLIQDRLASRYRVDEKILTQHILGTTFKNPVGIGAGFDKNATMVEALYAFGFGAVEFGTLTPLPQQGNPKPRLFRYPEFNSIQNAMGFNNDGLDTILPRVKDLYPYKIPIGANIGKNKLTSQEDALDDYSKLVTAFSNHCDYIVINISSPNTPGLRDLQNEEFIKEVFLMATKKTNRPILLKIAPDLEVKDALDISHIAIENGASGIIATNTTIDYSLLPNAKDFGGISGEVLKKKSYLLFKEIAKELHKDTILISVGGIDSGKEAYRRIRAGANLVQILSSLIFKGPSLARDINLELIELLKRDGFNHISEAVGVDLR